MATETVLRLPQRRPLGGVGEALARFNRYPVIPIAILLFLLVLPAVFAEVIAPYDPLEGRLSERLVPPGWVQGGSWDHILGTDKQGRDILTRIIFGARISLAISLTSIAIGCTIGTTLGLCAAYFGKWADAIIMRVVDTFLSMPLILLALVTVAVFGPGFGTVIGVVACLLWIGYTRQVRGEALSIKQLDFVARAKVAGASPVRIMFRHILPNVVDRKSTRLNSSHIQKSRMPSSA